MHNINQLLEKYLTTIEVPSWEFRSGNYEIFINPSKRDLRDAIGDSKGYHFIIDWEKKNVYVFSANQFHETVMNNIPELPDFDSFWKQGNEKIINRIFTGDIYGMNGAVNSDALYADIYKRYQINDMLDRDWSWVKRYLPVDKIKDLLENY